MYYLVYGIFYLISLLPLQLLYLLSDFAYFVIYYVTGYRKDVVMKNLTIAFPSKTEAEKTRIAKDFYHNFTDTFIETIKFISAGHKFFDRHLKADFSIVEPVYKKGHPIQFHVGHNFNWELANLAMPSHLPDKVVGVYMPLKNKIFDRMFRQIRSKFGTQLVAATRMRQEMMPYRGKQYILGLVADQSPPGPDKAYWVNFFGKPTGFLKAPEDAARRNNLPVFFAHFTKIKRGYYQAHIELATEEPQQLAPGQLTRIYAEYLERTMRKNPEMWLWSHRRWKHAWKPEYGLIEPA
jgi:Kdo2-lipid IVA lauroyltransferase/acyltransferase